MPRNSRILNLGGIPPGGMRTILYVHMYTYNG
jgi:hypothetical protein